MYPNLPECYYRVSVKALVLNDTRDKFLLTKPQHGRWELPGGGLEWGTTARDDVVREIREEMGVGVTWVAPHPCYFFTWHARTQHAPRANVLYEVQLDSLDFTPSDECTLLMFVTAHEARALPLLPNVALFVEQFDATRH